MSSFPIVLEVFVFKHEQSHSYGLCIAEYIKTLGCFGSEIIQINLCSATDLTHLSKRNNIWKRLPVAGIYKFNGKMAVVLGIHTAIMRHEAITTGILWI
jgi:hypothetical protein